LLLLVSGGESSFKLFQDDLVNKMCHNPRKIFNLPEQPNTYIEVNLDEVWTIPKETSFSKAKWTPFAGMALFFGAQISTQNFFFFFLHNKPLFVASFGL